jgi:hypothetical protein
MEGEEVYDDPAVIKEAREPVQQTNAREQVKQKKFRSINCSHQQLLCFIQHGLCFHAFHCYPESLEGFLYLDVAGKPTMEDVNRATKFIWTR